MRGFTLIEVITTIAIMTVIMVAVSAFQYNVFNYNNSSAVSLTNIQEIQSILRTMTKEIRSMRSGADGSYPIVSAATTSLTFYSDIDGDLVQEKIRYYLGPGPEPYTVMYRGVTKASGSPATYNSNNETTKILVTGVRVSTSTPIFEYFDSMYSGITNPMTYPLNLTSIRLVKITMSIDTDPYKSPLIKTYTTQAQLRNLKDNL